MTPTPIAMSFHAFIVKTSYHTFSSLSRTIFEAALVRADGPEEVVTY